MSKDERINFSNFIMSLAQTVYVQLGIVEDPFNNQKSKEVEQAKGTIDLLEMLKEKTKGNLTEEEEKLFEDIMYDLKMKYLYEMDKSDKKS